jgi:N-acetylmuramoyl-L-alanine amidase
MRESFQLDFWMFSNSGFRYFLLTASMLLASELNVAWASHHARSLARTGANAPASHHFKGLHKRLPVHNIARHHSLPVLSRWLPLIVIDPGHGGIDPGAIGLAGTLEKTVTLATAIELQRQLEGTRHYRVLMTRKQDTFVSLSQRLAFARLHKAALFISIHADASTDHQAHGASVYVRSGISSGSTMMTRFNGPKGGIAHALSVGQGPRSGSALLQYAIVDSLDDDIRMADEPSRQGHLYVLAYGNIPGVLVEMGFLSNKRDEALLKSVRHRFLVAKAIREAVDDYFHLSKTARQTLRSRADGQQ